MIYKLIIRLLLAMILFFAMLSNSHSSNKRYNDPDGCFSCHNLGGLQYIDKNGLLRDASINESHYYSSLHGSVPCRDCHRKTSYYPHIEENAEVDCADSCHVNEPSKGEAFSHKDVVDEFVESAHGSGDTKGFTGANRLAEDDRSKSPSCRRCHSNTAYIEDFQMEKFMDAFQHTDAECGSCHPGEAWMNQLSGHILRRLVGARWKKQDSNKVCNDCHADLQQMKKVELKDPVSGEKHPSDYRWQHASASYANTLHSRILQEDNELGASCLDCHAPKAEGKEKVFRHGIKNALDKQSPTHNDNLVKTCGQSQCHQFSKDSVNQGFIKSDQHSLDRLPLSDYGITSLFDPGRMESNWYRAFLILGLISLIFVLGNIIQVFLKSKKTAAEPVIGSNRFKAKVLGRPVKKKGEKKKDKAKPGTKAKPDSKPKKQADSNNNNQDK